MNSIEYRRMIRLAKNVGTVCPLSVKICPHTGSVLHINEHIALFIGAIEMEYLPNEGREIQVLLHKFWDVCLSESCVISSCSLSVWKFSPTYTHSYLEKEISW